MKPLGWLLLLGLLLAAGPVLAQPRAVTPGGPGGPPGPPGGPPGPPGPVFPPGGPPGGGPGPILGKRGPLPVPTPKHYRPFPVEGNLSARLQEDLLEATALQEAIEKLKALQDDPEAKALLQEALSGKMNDPVFRERFREFFEKQPGALKLDPEQLKAVQRALEKRKEEMAAPRPPVDPGQGKEPSGLPPPAAPPPPAPEADEDGGPVQKFLRDLGELLQKPSNARLREKLMQSPAFTHAMQDWLAKKRGENADGGGSPGGGGSGSEKNTLPGLPDPSQLQLPTGGAGSAEPLVPGLGSIGDSSAAIQWLLALVATGVAAAVVWKLLASRKRAVPQAVLAGLGPWPVDPERVATREQLVQAFEYLAVFLLGDDARTANHRAIAGSLGGTAELGRAAGDLATLYETARYDPAGELPPPALAAARRDLCLLAGRPAALPGEP